MESVAKRYFWIINVLLLTGIAYLGALVINNGLAELMVSMTITKSMEEEKDSEAGAETNRPEEDWATLVVGRNLFNANPSDGDGDDDDDASDENPEDEKAPEAPPGQIPGPGEHCEESKAQVELNATLVAEPADKSMAALREEGEDRLAGIGSKVADHTLVAVYRNKIILEDAGQYTCVEAGKRKSSSRRQSKSKSYGSGSSGRSNSSSKADSAKIKEGIKKTGKGTYEVSRLMLEEQLEDFGKISKQARVIPHYRNGKTRGFKLVGVRPNSLYSAIGVKSGDVLKAVNGEEINSPNKALELFDKLKSLDNVTLDLERRGRKTTLEYTIQ